MGYKIKYYFDSDTHFLFEIKNENTKETDKSKIYSWILIDKTSLEITYLNFVSMDEEGRTFKEGRFNIYGNSASLHLEDKLIIFIPERVNIDTYSILINAFAQNLNDI